MVGFYSEIIVRVAIFLYALWIGGLATTIYNRVPNEIPIGPSQKPRCNRCGNEIKFKYFFPVLGYFFSKGKCINCGMKIPRVYLFLELSILFYILTLSTTFEIFDEKFITKSLYGAFMVVLLFIYHSHKQIKARLIWMLVSFILAYRGYNYCLPDVIDLFISGVSSFLAFSIIKKHIPIELHEFEMCVILSSSLGMVVSVCYLIVAIILKVAYSILKYQNLQAIKREYIVYISLLIAIAITFFE